MFIRGTNRLKTRQPDEPLTEEDRLLLLPLLARAKELGRTPTVAEVPTAAQIKRRFGAWKYAVVAAGLPSLNDPEQMRLRQQRGTD